MRTIVVIVSPSVTFRLGGDCVFVCVASDDRCSLLFLFETAVSHHKKAFALCFGNDPHDFRIYTNVDLENHRI